MRTVKIFFFAILVMLMQSFNSKRTVQNIHFVSMIGMKFVPNKIEIKAGETIRWVNESNDAHNVIENNKLFKSEMLQNRNDVYEYTFTEPGTYKYYCKPHRIMGMKGIVIVK